MGSLVTFDQKGIFGPAMTLVYHSQYLNEKGVLSVADLLKENFKNLANVKPKGKKEFCAFVLERNQANIPITPAEIIGTRFFQNMQKTHPVYHEKVLEFIVPRMLRTLQEQIPQAKKEIGETQQLTQWIALLVENYMPEEQIKKHCALKDQVSEKTLDERQDLGKELYNAIKTENLKEKDFDTLIEISNIALDRIKNAEDASITLNFTSRYLSLFSKSENPKLLGEDVVRMLSTVFKPKVFPQKSAEELK